MAPLKGHLSDHRIVQPDRNARRGPPSGHKEEEPLLILFTHMAPGLCGLRREGDREVSGVEPQGT